MKSSQQGCHAYCHECDWYATPEDHDLADVLTAADAHATFNRDHSTRAGFSEAIAEEALSRKDGDSSE